MKPPFWLCFAGLFITMGLWALTRASEPPMTKQEQKTQLEAQTEAADRRTKLKYIEFAMREAERPDDIFLEHGREYVRSLGQGFLECLKDVDAKQKELESIKKVLLERKAQ